MMYVNDMRMPLRMSLVRKEDMSKYHISTDEVPGFMGTVRPQLAGPYAGVKIDIMQSKLGVPCNKPPFGTMTAIDLKSKSRLGSTNGYSQRIRSIRCENPYANSFRYAYTGWSYFNRFWSGVLRRYSGLLPTCAGFKTGKEVWKAELPVAAVAAPLIYKSPKTGKQYVVISAGGASHSKDVGDYIIAFALPDQK